MADLAVTAADVAAVRVIEQITAPAAEAIDAGEVVRYDTATGRLALGNGTTAAEARVVGVAINSASQAGDTITAITQGIVDLGDALDALDYDAPVYASDTDGTLGGAAGDATVDVIVGRVIPGWGHTTADKLLRVAL